MEILAIIAQNSPVFVPYCIQSIWSNLHNVQSLLLNTEHSAATAVIKWAQHSLSQIFLHLHHLFHALYSHSVVLKWIVERSFSSEVSTVTVYEFWARLLCKCYELLPTSTHITSAVSRNLQKQKMRSNAENLVCHHVRYKTEIWGPQMDQYQKWPLVHKTFKIRSNIKHKFNNA